MKVGIIGLGFVGLPLLLEMNKKFSVFGFEKEISKIKMLKNNISYISDISNINLKKSKLKNLFEMNKINKIIKCDYIIFCVPTPLKNKSPDMSYIKNSFSTIFPFLRKNQTIILESSVYPGATQDIFLKKLSSKFTVGKDFFLCYSPERIDPGKSSKEKKIEYKKITKLVSGYSKKCTDKIKYLYSKIFKNIYVCQSIRVAETAKIYENIFRAVNIGLANEMKILCDKININVHQVIEAAGTKPFGFKKFSPGPGVGGHCIPIDPLFMKWIAKKKGHEAKFIDLGIKTNKNVTNWIINRIKKIFKKNVKYKVLILGIAYKQNLNDLRESPALEILKRLKKIKNLSVEYEDPYIDNFKIGNLNFYSNNTQKYKNYDFTILCTDHVNFNYKKILKYSKKIIDTRGIYKFSDSPKILHL